MSRPQEARVAVVGATGAVGRVALDLLAERGYANVRVLASRRSAGERLRVGPDQLEVEVEEATPELLESGEFDVCLFSVGTSASRELVPHAVRGGALVVDKSAAYRLEEGVPLVVPEVNGHRALEHDGVVANPNCCTIPLTAVLKPLHDEAGLTRLRLATYQSISGAGARRMQRFAAERPEEHDLVADWPFEGDETDEEAKLRAETRKVLELPDLPVSATTVRVPVLVGHSEAVWAEFERPLDPERATELLAAAPGLRVVDVPTPATAAGTDEILVGRVRPDRAGANGLALFLCADNLRKGAALNAIQIAELVLSRERALTA